ncbi:recombinase family protein [Victivallis lenta]|uniref:recombinase family protein n=1 Tax=Victivallis lenta TaxID=2606640 RepID=UPI003AB1CA0A
MKCIIYTRVSTDMQDTANQLSQLKEYAHKQNWQILDVKTDICSGSKSAEERTGLKEAFDLARRRKFDVLLFWSLDRFSREGSRKTLEYLTRLDHCGIKWHSYTEEYISSLGIFADAIISLMACLAKQERIRISERTKAGLARVKSKGIRLGRPKTDIVIIQTAKELKTQGFSYAAIGRELNLSKARAFQLCNEQ